jgi:hypothetical protein
MRTRTLLKSCPAVAALFVVTIAPLLSSAQTQGEPGYLETSRLKVRQDKVAEFNQLAMRIADANRRGNGDHWTAIVDMYGRDNFVWMVASRNSLSEIEPGMNKFGSAVKEFMGMPLDRLMAEASKLTDSSTSELRVRRPDLSWNITDMPSWMARVARAKYLAVVNIHVKPGHIVDAEKQVMMIRDAMNGKPEAMAASVSQVRFGGDPGTLWITIPLAEITDIDKMSSPRTVLGEEGYRQYSEMAAQNYASVEFSLKRFVPEWSNPPAAFVEANPKFWTVKPVPAMAKPKATPPAAKPAAASGQ